MNSKLLSFPHCELCALCGYKHFLTAEPFYRGGGYWTDRAFEEEKFLTAEIAETAEIGQRKKELKISAEPPRTAR